MSRTFKDNPNSKQNRPKRSRQRDISVRAVRRNPPDLRKLSRALIALAMAESDQENQEQPDTGSTTADTADTLAATTSPETKADRSPDA